MAGHLDLSTFGFVHCIFSNVLKCLIDGCLFPGLVSLHVACVDFRTVSNQTQNYIFHTHNIFIACMSHVVKLVTCTVV